MSPLSQHEPSQTTNSSTTTYHRILHVSERGSKPKKPKLAPEHAI